MREVPQKMNSKEYNHSRALSVFFASVISLLIALSPVAYRLYGWVPPLLGLLTVCLLITSRRPFFLIDWPLMALMASVCVLGGASVLWSDVPALSLDRAISNLPVILGGFLILHAGRLVVFQDKKIRHQLCVWPFIIGLALMSFEIVTRGDIHQFLRGLPTEKRVGLSILNQGVVILAIMTVPAVYAAWGGLQKHLLALVLAAAGTLVCWISDSETAKLAVLAGLIVSGFTMMFPKLSWAIVGAGSVAAILVMPLLILQMSGKWPDALLGWREAHTEHRLLQYERVSQQVAKSPWIGHGLESAQNLKIYDASISDSGLNIRDPRIFHPHNASLQLWLEMGVLGALWGGGLIILILQRISALRSWRSAMALGTFSAGISVALTGYGLWQGWLVGLFFLAATLVVLSTGQNKESGIGSASRP